jgi:signal transduction histidine kinase
LTVVAPDHEWGFWSAREMRRAIWNLASNAIKYGDQKTRVEIRIKSAGATVELAVHNHGPVIPQGDRDLLFEPFGRAISVRAAAKRGWGLGLTLVKGCVEAHGGVVEIESDPQEGTTFTLRFPSDAAPFQPRTDAVPTAD